MNIYLYIKDIYVQGVMEVDNLICMSRENVNADTHIHEVLKILSVRLRKLVGQLSISWNELQEIRLRINEPIIMIYGNREYFVSEKGQLTSDKDKAVVVTSFDIKETLEYISNYSLYAYEDEIKQGFITIQGGHRVGIAGKVVLENGIIKCVRHISFVNIRMSHEIKGCSQRVMPFISLQREVAHTLIISPPRCGKTTLLRDIIRTLSDGNELLPGMTVGVVDERSEIAACYKGIPQNDVGIRTDILDCCPKAYGMLMLIRSMSPQVIAVDELGGHQDIDAVYDVINCGCKLIATIHGNSIDDIRNRPGIRRLVEERIFERYIVLNGSRKAGHVYAIFDQRGSRLYKEEP
ncbi:MAG: stage III sporulation protein AA [Coprococcus sp.]